MARKEEETAVSPCMGPLRVGISDDGDDGGWWKRCSVCCDDESLMFRTMDG